MSKYLTYAEELEMRGKAIGKIKAILVAYDSLGCVEEVASILPMSADRVQGILNDYEVK